jgi:hypothetical protein
MLKLLYLLVSYNIYILHNKLFSLAKENLIVFFFITNVSLFRVNCEFYNILRALESASTRSWRDQDVQGYAEWAGCVARSGVARGGGGGHSKSDRATSSPTPLARALRSVKHQRSERARLRPRRMKGTRLIPMPSFRVPCTPIAQIGGAVHGEAPSRARSIRQSPGPTFAPIQSPRARFTADRRANLGGVATALHAARTGARTACSARPTMLGGSAAGRGARARRFQRSPAALPPIGARPTPQRSGGT